MHIFFKFEAAIWPCSFLLERLMNDVVEEIFNYLDYESLKNSEAVSSLWYNNILYGKTWKKLLERNVMSSQIIITNLKIVIK